MFSDSICHKLIVKSLYKVQTKEYYYEYNSPIITNTIGLTKKLNYKNESCGAGAPARKSTTGVFYSIYSTFVNPSSIVTTDIDNSGQTIETTETFTYEKEYFQLKEKKVEIPSDSKTTKYCYAFNWDCQSISMVNANMISIPLETIINDGSGGGSKIEYTLSAGSILRPSKSYTAKNDLWEVSMQFFYIDLDSYPERIKSKNKILDDYLTWGTGNEKGLLMNRSYGDRIWTYTYHPTRKLHTITDFNNLTTTYTYDAFNRLSYRSENNGQRWTSYDYAKGLNDIGLETTSTTSFLTDQYTLPDHIVKSKTDAYGRTIETRQVDFAQDGSDFITSQEFDCLGRVITSTDPAKGGTSKTTYYRRLDSRVDRHTPAGSPDDKFIKNVYSHELGQYVTNSNDENGNKSLVFTDAFGRKMKSVVDAQHLNLTTSYTYNDRDQILTITPPGNSTDYVYTYYPNGNLNTKSIPNKGIYTYTYNFQNQVLTEELPNADVLWFEYHSSYNDFQSKVTLIPANGGDNVVIKANTMIGYTGRLDKEILATFSSGQIDPAAITNEFTYDIYGRLKTENRGFLSNGSDYNVMTYDHANNVRTVKRTHTGINYNTVLETTIEYDRGIRPIDTWLSHPDLGNVNISHLTYGSNDWLLSKSLWNQRQDISYGYNSRGWLTHINNAQSNIPDQAAVPCGDDYPGGGTDCDCGPFEGHQEITLFYDSNQLNNGDSTNIKVQINTSKSNSIGEITNNSRDIIQPFFGGSYISMSNYPNQITFNLNVKDSIRVGVENIEAKEEILTILSSCITTANQSLVIGDLSSLGIQMGSALPNMLGLGEDGPPISLPVPNLFGMEIHYFDGSQALEAHPQYNGNISWMEWSVFNEPVQAYGFQYDGANRLIQAKHRSNSISSCDNHIYGQYDMTASYDDKGNINSLTRNGFLGEADPGQTFGQIDNLTYTYLGDELQSVGDGSDVGKGFKGLTTNYDYEFGNLISDSQKGIDDINYTFFDLPTEVLLANGKSMHFIYDANGRKLRQSESVFAENKWIEIKVNDYMDGIEYKNSVIEAIMHEEGRIVVETLNNSPINSYHEFFLKDHLGNIRVKFADKDNSGNLDLLNYTQLQQALANHDEDLGELLGSYHYYPFGMNMEGNSTQVTGVHNKYTYNGKEEISGLGIDLLDYGARFYDPSIARFTTVDRFASEFPSWSPYHYANTNPISNIDFNGDSTRVYNTSGAYQMTINDDLANEDHFYSSKQLEMLCNTSSCGTVDEQGQFYRDNSSFFMGENTRSQIDMIRDNTDGEAFFALSKTNSGELEAIDLTNMIDQQGRDHIVPSRSMIKNMYGVDHGIVGTGHTHTDNSIISFNSLTNPNNLSDYTPLIYQPINYYPSHLALIAGPKNINIYSTAKIQGLKVSFPNRTSKLIQYD